jgi:hypothetical protein
MTAFQLPLGDLLRMEPVTDAQPSLLRYCIAFASTLQGKNCERHTKPEVLRKTSGLERRKEAADMEFSRF